MGFVSKSSGAKGVGLRFTVHVILLLGLGYLEFSG